MSHWLYQSLCVRITKLIVSSDKYAARLDVHEEQHVVQDDPNLPAEVLLYTLPVPVLKTYA